MKYLVLLLLSLNAYATKMTEVKDACQNIKWEKVKCQFLEESPHGMSYSDEDGHTTRVVNLGGFLGALTEQMENINNPQQSCIGSQSNLSRLTRYTSALANRKPLTACQKACVVKCVTSSYVKYDSSVYTEEGIKKDSACQVANTGKGICRAFASLADHLMDSLGLKSRSVAKPNHAYNRVKFDKKWYYLEPQDPECRFIKR